MQNTIFHLSTCSTCQRILAEWAELKDIRLQDIKAENISPEQLDALKELAGSYEELFSRRAQLYRSRNLDEKDLTEDDYRLLILEHYTFLKRPVAVINGQIFIGNSPKTVAAAKAAIQS